jgi:hypothetical protein
MPLIIRSRAVRLATQMRRLMAFPGVSDLGIGNAEAVLFDSVQGDELDVGVVVRIGAVEGGEHVGDKGAVIVTVQPQVAAVQGV